MNYLALKPAQIMGIERFKGSIEVGKHADFFVFDPYDKFNHSQCYS